MNGFSCVVLAILILCSAAPGGADPSLVLRYTFDEESPDTVIDQSTYGNNGTLVGGKFLPEFDGQKGVLRFDGENALLTCPKTESLKVDGDATFEMRVRLNGTVMNTWALFFGDEEDYSFYYAGFHSTVLWYCNRDPLQKTESMLVPVDRNIITSDAWSHFAMVVEYPRCKFYKDGKLVRDAYMPIPGIPNNVNSPILIGRKLPMDLDEFRLYRRALSPAEIAAHADGKELAITESEELAIEPNWYENTVTMRLNCKGGDFTGDEVDMKLGATGERQSAALTESWPGSGRFVATASFPLTPAMQNQPIKAIAQLKESKGRAAAVVTQEVMLVKPEWIGTREGYPEQVPAPWTPVRAAANSEGVVEVGVWNRTYAFGKGLFPQRIETVGKDILAAPISLTATADGKEVAWRDGVVKISQAAELGSTLKMNRQSDALALSVNASVEFDGYIIFECELSAKEDVSLEALRFDVPLKSEIAKLCYGDRVFPPNDEIPMKENHRSAIGGDLAFRFSPVIWLGDVDRGIVWQAESDQDWRNVDRLRAIEVLPNGDTTTFRAHFVDVPTNLPKGKSLRYKFALQATPIKPVVRDAWQLRIMRGEPYGREISLPDMTTNGKPSLDYLADAGLQYLMVMGCDLWPYSMPVSETFAGHLRRFIHEMHSRGMKTYTYQIHERFATMAPEFDLYGLNMAQRPMNQYLPANSPPGDPRPGPVGLEYGANSQGTIFGCPRSQAYQDACIASLAKRLDTFGDDGVYLDGSGQCPPCGNQSHGCGYMLEDGTIRKTYPVFAVHDFMRRIYTTVKKRNAENVVDLHCSFGYNPPASAYADVIWTGEQWFHLRGTGTTHISSELKFDMFQTEFMGTATGTAAETLAYRLGPQMKVAAISLLHDVPVRGSTDGLDQQNRGKSPDKADYTQLLVKLWAVRDKFGAAEAEKLYYWNNQSYVSLSPEGAYSTLLKHPTNGVLAVISNLAKDEQAVEVTFNLESLGLKSQPLHVINALTDEPVVISADGKVSIPLGSEEWTYIWLKPGK